MLPLQMAPCVIEVMVLEGYSSLYTPQYVPTNNLQCFLQYKLVLTTISLGKNFSDINF